MKSLKRMRGRILSIFRASKNIYCYNHFQANFQSTWSTEITDCERFDSWRKKSSLHQSCELFCTRNLTLKYNAQWTACSDMLILLKIWISIVDKSNLWLSTELIKTTYTKIHIINSYEKWGRCIAAFRESHEKNLR